MSWFAVSAIEGPTTPRRFADGGVMGQGTLMIETAGRLDDRPRVLFTTTATLDAPVPGDLTLRRDTGGRIVAEVTTATATARATVALAQLEPCQTLRISMTWGAEGSARLWISAPEVYPTPRFADLTMPLAPTRAALARAIGGLSVSAAADLAYAAASDRIEPVGAMPGLGGAARLMTQAGPARLDSLSAGETILALDRHGTLQPVPILTTLVRSLPARGSCRPVRLFAPYFGLTSDLVLSANEHVTLAGPDVEYLFAQERVLVPARFLISHRTGEFVSTGDTVTWHQVLLPAQEQLRLNNLTVESLYIGGLRRAPEAHAATMVADVPRRILPHHAAPTYPVLSEFEAATLLDQLAR